MLHNSLFRRGMLAAMNRHPLVLQRRAVHRNVGPVAGAKASAGQIRLEGAWSVRPARNLPAERAVAADAADFLRKLGLDVREEAGNEVLLEVGSAGRGFRLVATPTRLEVHGSDAAALWAGWVNVENQMRTAGGAIVSAGEIQREPAWHLQIAPPAWGANYAVPDLSSEYLGDDTFRSLAHAGADGMFIYGDLLLYARDTRLAGLNHPDAAQHLATLREATERAAAYGVALYFVAVGPKLPADHAVFVKHPSARGARLFAKPGDPSPSLHCLCSSDEIALGFHADVFSTMFREVPRLGGLVLIIGGESYYHCFMRAGGAGVGHTNCKRCEGKVPEAIIANLLKTTADAARTANPRAAVMAWPYSARAFWSDEPNQLKLIDHLPEGVALLSEIDKDQVLHRRGYAKPIWDYSVEFDGHSDRIVAQAIRCAQRQRDLVVKTETAHGIELLHLPYVPSIGRSARRWQSLRAIRPSGVLQRWGFVGMFDSVAERIGYLARWDPDFAPADATRQVARQLFGNAADAAVSAWEHFDESVGYIPLLTTRAYYCGPMFLGPCHPLPVWDAKSGVPDAFKGQLYYLQEHEASLTEARIRQRDDLTLSSTLQLVGVPLAIVEAEYTRARDAAEAGYAILRDLDPRALPPHARDELIEQQAIGEYLYRTYRTTVNVIRFLRLHEQSGGEPAKHRLALVEVAKDELANTHAARRVYEVAPWLNHNLRLDVGVGDSLAMIDAKLRLLDEFLSG